MPLDAGIYNALGVRPKSVMDYTNELNAADQNALALKTGQIGYQNALQSQRDDQAMREAARGFGTDPQANYNALLQTGNVKGAQSYLAGVLANQKTAADTKLATSHAGNFDADVVNKHLDALGTLSKGVMANPTPQAAQAALVQWEQLTGKQDPSERASVMALQTPEQVMQWAKAHALRAEDLKTQFQTRNTGGSTQTIAIDPLTNKVTVASEVANTTSPDAVLQAKTSTANNASTNATSRANNQANIQKDYTIAGIDANGQPVEGGGLLSPQAIINAATRYQIDGTLPPNLGRGAQGPRQTSQILNEAARQAAERGDSPEAQRITQLANKSSAAALTKLETQQTMVGAFEKNFAKNADIAQELSNKVDRTGIPLVNKWVNAGKRSISGDPDISAFDASVKATVNEYGKIVGGGTGSSATAQGEIAKIEGLLNAAQTKEQVKSVLDLMRRETANRMTAFEDQKTELKNGMIRPKAAAAPASAAGAHPADIQSLLDKYGK